MKNMHVHIILVVLVQCTSQQTITTYLRTPSLDRATVLTERLGGSFAYATTEQLVYRKINHPFLYPQYVNTYNPTVLILLPGLKHDGVYFNLQPPLYHNNNNNNNNNNDHPSENMDNIPETTTELPVEIIDTGKSDLDSVNTNDIDEESVVIDSAAH